MGGELGWLGLGVLAPEFEETMINEKLVTFLKFLKLNLDSTF